MPPLGHPPTQSTSQPSLTWPESTRHCGPLEHLWQPPSTRFPMLSEQFQSGSSASNMTGVSSIPQSVMTPAPQQSLAPASLSLWPPQLPLAHPPCARTAGSRMQGQHAGQPQHHVPHGYAGIGTMAQMEIGATSPQHSRGIQTPPHRPRRVRTQLN